MRTPARSNAVVHFGVGNEVLVCNLDEGGIDETPTCARWATTSEAQTVVAEKTASAVLTLREREIASMARGTYVEDEFASLHEFTRSVANALEEASSSEEALEGAENVALSRAVWELLDVYFVSRGGGFGVATDEIVEWYRRNAASLALGDDSASGRLRSLLGTLRASARPEEERGYWDMIVTMVAVGWTDAAVDLIGMHSAWAEWRLRKTSVQPQVELMEAAVALLRTTPRLGGEDGAPSVPTYASFRNEWLRQVKTVLAEGGLFNKCWGPTADGVRNVLLVLSGDERTIDAAVGNWLELTLAQLRHRYPTLKIQGEHESLARASKRTKGGLVTEALDALLTSIIAGDSQGVVSVCSRHLDPWFMAYSTAMLSRAGGAQADILRRPTASGASQSELYMLEYCSSLATSERTRELAVRLLAASCSQRGVEMMATTIMRLAVTEDDEETEDDAPAKAAHALAEDVGLSSTSARVAKMASERARANGYVSLAFDWLKKSNDAAASDALARALSRVTQSERGDASAALARVDGFMAKSGDDVVLKTSDPLVAHENCVDFYRERAKFNRAMRLLRSGADVTPDARAAARSAADALIAALAPSSTPPELWTALIIDAVPLFESPFSARSLFTDDARRLLSARLHAASSLSTSASASHLDAVSARPPTVVTASNLTESIAAFALARLTARLAFDDDRVVVASSRE